MKRKVWIFLFVLAVIVNVIAWNSSAFCDFYIEKIFPWLGGSYSRITSVFPFSVGEAMIILAVLFCAVLAAAGILRIFVKRAWTVVFWRRMSRAFCWIGLCFFWIMTCNCLIQYHASAFEEKYMEQVRSGGYSNAELAALRDHIVINLNELSGQMARDEQGYLIYEGELYETAIRAMQQLGEEYELLQGYYPRPKEIYFSNLLSQSYMMGYYFPFSMEANYNKEMYVVNLPSVICHELAHLKGIIQEDEANLIGYLACVMSEDVFFQYSGYMGVLNYVEKEFLNSIQRDAAEYSRHPQILQQVYEDDIFLTEKAWEQVEEKAVINTQTVKKVSNAATEATLRINGVEEGMKSYSGVVELLLHFYDGVLFGKEYE